MKIKAQNRLTAASSYSWFNSYAPVRWKDKEKMQEILKELREGKEGDRMTTVEGGIILGSTCFAMEDNGDWRIVGMDNLSNENNIMLVTRDFIKNCAKYLK